MPVRVGAFVIIIAIAVGIIGISVGIGFFITQEQFLETIQGDLAVVAETADRLLTGEIRLLKGNVSTAAWHLRASAPGEFHRTLEEQVEIYPGFLALTVIQGLEAGEGGLRIAASRGSPPVHPSFLGGDFFRRSLEREFLISSTLHDPLSGQLVFYVSIALEGNRVLAATVDGGYFAEILRGLAIYRTGHIFILDGEGVLLADPRPHWVENRYNLIEMAKTDSQYAGAAAVMGRMIRGESGEGRYYIEGTERMCSFRPVSGSLMGWSLGVVAPFTEGPIKNFRSGMILTALLCVVFSLISAVFCSSILAQPYLRIRGILAEKEYQETLLHTTNRMADIFLRTDSSRFTGDLHTCMGMIAQSVGVDRMRLFFNEDRGEGPWALLYHEWLREDPGAELSRVEFSYIREAPHWFTELLSGRCINALTRDQLPEERALLSRYGVVSVLVIPLFLQGEFRGFVSFDDCRGERVFSPDEQGIVGSGISLGINSYERNRMFTDLVRTQKEAEAATEAKSRFLANMSHEMRTPLNAIIGFSELALGSGGFREGEEENLVKIYNSAVILLGLINDILDLSKIESGKFEIIPVEYAVPSLINDTVTLNSVRIGSKPISFHLDIDERLPALLRGDDLRIKQMFNNLLSNAFKYTQRGRVDWSISARREGDSVWLVSVFRDTGIGIRAEDIERLFSDYNQVDTRSNRRIEGTGLGLSITKWMAEMMDGSITVESEYGAGSAFTLTLRQGFVSDQTIGPQTAERLRTFQYSEHKRDRSAKLVRAELPYARVLVVDDVPTNLDVARGLLKPYGMEVDCVTSGDDAAALIREGKTKYNAVFMDHMMPGMDGIEAARLIREEGGEYTRKLPIIALTANAVVGNEELFLSQGFQAFLSKPIDIMALDTAVNRWVRDRSLEKDARDAGGPVPAPEAPDFERGKLFSAGIPGLDMEKALERFSGDGEVYREVLKSYVKNSPAFLDKLRESAGGETEAYRIAVHGLKGASRSIGAEALGARAEALERAARKGDLEYIRRSSGGFIEEAEGLLAALGRALEEGGGEETRPLRPEPDRALLGALLEAGRAYDIDGADRALESLEAFRYEAGGELVPWLREQLDNSNFPHLSSRLEEVLGVRGTGEQGIGNRVRS
jgi:signal transduction histidine kinase/HPt (histidine-containing phosphotransfer) domain-containing protein/AmiR/NasT family two-component response regulator